MTPNPQEAFTSTSPGVLRETFPVGPLQCNCTILGDPGTREAMVVDPGGDLARIVDALARHALTLKSIVVTHAHLDHIAGAASLQKLTGAPVLYHPADLSLVAVMHEQAAWMGVAVPEVKPPDEGLAGGANLHLGSSAIQVLHTPGHTPGSICLYAPEQQFLLAGDTLFRGSVGRTDLWGGNTSQLLRSLQSEIVHLPEGTLVIPGHGTDTTVGREREHNDWLRHL